MHPNVTVDRFFAVDGQPQIAETDPAGAGTVTFGPSGAYHVFRPGGQPIAWLANQKCADGAILAVDNQGAMITHLVELKSKLKASDWPGVKAQLEGLMLNVRALCAATEQPLPSAFRAYVAFKHDALSASASAAPVLLKAPVGEPAVHNTLDWEAGMLTLLGQGGIQLTKIERDAQGDGVATLCP